MNTTTTSSLVLLALVPLLFATTGLGASPPGHRPLVVAHRGASAVAPENSMAAFRAALDAGAEVVEFDLYLSADGHVVLFHDRDLKRIAGIDKTPGELTLDELRQLDVGSWMDSRFAGERIPTLDEALELIRGKARVHMDLKVDGLGKPIAEALERTGFPIEDALLGPWTEAHLGDIRRHLPHAPVVFIGSVPEEYSAAWMDRQVELGAGGFSMNWSTLSARFLGHARQRGLPVFAWTINDPQEIEAAILAGVDGVVTDDPALARRLIEEVTARE